MRVAKILLALMSPGIPKYWMPFLEKIVAPASNQGTWSVPFSVSGTTQPEPAEMHQYASDGQALLRSSFAPLTSQQLQVLWTADFAYPQICIPSRGYCWRTYNMAVTAKTAVIGLCLQKIPRAPSMAHLAWMTSMFLYLSNVVGSADRPAVSQP